MKRTPAGHGVAAKWRDWFRVSRWFARKGSSEPKYRFAVKPLIVSLAVFCVLLSVAVTSYYINSAALPDEILLLAEREREKGDHAREAEWLRRYLLLKPTDYQAQALLALAVDSSYGTSNGEIELGPSFLASQQLENALQLADVTEQQDQILIRRRLAARYIELSEVVFSSAMLESDIEVQDSLLMESLDYLEKAAGQISDNLLGDIQTEPSVQNSDEQNDLAEQDAILSRQIAIRHAVTAQMFNSNARLESRTEHNSDRKVSLHGKAFAASTRKPGDWFDETLRQAVVSDPLDYRFLRFLLARFDNQEFPWRSDSVAEGWYSKVWSRLPHEILSRVSEDDTSQSRLVKFAMLEVQNRGLKDPPDLESQWTQAGDDALALLAAEETGKTSDRAMDANALFWEKTLLAAAWTRLPELDDERQDRWWAQLNISLKGNGENVLQQLCIERAKRFIRKQDVDNALICWRQATELQGASGLSAWAAIADHEISRYEQRSDLESSVIQSSSGECERVLSRYGKAIRKTRIDIRDRNIAVTNSWYQNRADYIGVHEFQLDVFKKRVRWLTGKLGAELVTFRTELKKRLESGLPAGMLADALVPLIQTLRRNGHYEAVALIVEDLLISAPESIRLRNQCADAWADAGFKQRATFILRSAPGEIGLEGRAKLLFADFMTQLKGNRNSASLASIRERAGTLRKEYLTSNSAMSDSSASEREMKPTGELVSEFLEIMIPPDGVALDNHFQNSQVREQVLAMAFGNLGNEWFYGLACELVRYADPEKQPALREAIEQRKEGGAVAFQFQQARATAAAGNYRLAVTQALELARENPELEASFKHWAAQLAAEAAGTRAGFEILDSINESSKTPLTFFQLATAELDLAAEARILGGPEAASQLERKCVERLAELESDHLVMEHQFSFLNIYKKHLELAVLSDGITKTESYGILVTELAQILAERPWWTPAHALMGRLHQAMRKHQLAEKHLALAVESGDKSLDTAKRLQQTLVAQGKQELAADMQRRVSKVSGVLRMNWASYLANDRRLSPNAAKLSYARGIACRHRTRDAWLLWANLASDICTAKLPYRQYAELTEQASFAHRKAVECEQGFSLPVVRMEFRLARLKGDQKRIDEIIEKLQQQSEKNAEASDLLTACYLSLGRIGSACDALNHACELEVSTERLSKLAQCYASIGRDQLAAECLERAVSLDADPRGSRRALARFYIQKTSAQEALAKIRTLYSTDELSSGCIFDFAELVAENFGPEGAREGLGRLKEMAEASPTATEQVCRATLRISTEAILNADQKDEAVPPDFVSALRASHLELVERGWQTEQDLRLYANALMCDSMHPSEKECSNLISALEVFPKSEFLSLKAKVKFATQKRENGSSDQALIKSLILTWRNSALESRRLPEKVANLLASAELYNNRLVEPAYDLFEETFHKNHRDALAYVELLGELNLDQEQIRVCELVLTADLEEGFASEFARTCHRTVAVNSCTEATLFKDKFLKRFPDNVDVLQFASRMHIERGELDVAASLLFKLNQLAPDRPGVLNNLAYCLSELPDRLDEALSLAARAYELAPHDPTVMDTLAVIRTKKGEAESAISLLQDAMMMKKEPRYLFHLLMAYEKIDETEKYQETLALLSQIDLDLSGLTKSEQEVYRKRFL